MCDYSLEMYASRPARAGEYYVTARFSTGSLGLAAPGDLQTAVCVQCDTRLDLEFVPPNIQRAYGLGQTETVTFIRMEKGAYKDGVRFANGRELSLQQLGPGVHVSLTPQVQVNHPALFGSTRRIAEDA